MRKRPTNPGATFLSCLIALLPIIAFSQATIASERKKIVSYSAEDLNPAKLGITEDRETNGVFSIKIINSTAP